MKSTLFHPTIHQFSIGADDSDAVFGLETLARNFMTLLCFGHNQHQR